MSGQFVPVKLNAEKEGTKVAARYGVTGFPTILFVNAQGQVEARIPGFMPAQPFAEEMRKAAQAHAEFPLLQAQIKRNPKDAKAAAQLAAIYAGRGNIGAAGPLLSVAEAGGKTTAYLARAENAVGDYYQEKQKFPEAIAHFRRAMASNPSATEAIYAQMSIAACHASQNKLKDAASDLEAALAIPNAPKDMRTQAQEMLAQLKKQAH